MQLSALTMSASSFAGRPVRHIGAVQHRTGACLLVGSITTSDCYMLCEKPLYSNNCAPGILPPQTNVWRKEPLVTGTTKKGFDRW